MLGYSFKTAGAATVPEVLNRAYRIYRSILSVKNLKLFDNRSMDGFDIGGM
jgi:hypothetical protein